MVCMLKNMVEPCGRKQCHRGGCTLRLIVSKGMLSQAFPSDKFGVNYAERGVSSSLLNMHGSGVKMTWKRRTHDPTLLFLAR